MDQTDKKQPFQVTFTYTNHNPDTIYNRLSRELGRPPTDRECIVEVKRILFSK